MTRFFLLCLLVFIIASCSNVYYNTTESEYNKKEAVSLIKALKKGTMVIQVPCEKRKLELLKNKAEKESDPKKQSTYLKEYNEYKTSLHYIQQSIIDGAIKQYNFSNYVFVPDTLIRAFKKGQRENVFLNASLEFIEDVKIDTSEVILFLRGQRQYDYMFIHKSDGSYPPRPFPYNSSMSNIKSYQKVSGKPGLAIRINWNRLFEEAFANIEYKLSNFLRNQTEQE